jgi:hypothetical protein
VETGVLGFQSSTTNDKKWAMKYNDVELLPKYAATKGAECRENAGQCGRMADEIAYKISSM